MKIDKFSKEILQELKIDGRISNIDLADKVGLSPSACLRRVQELERQGIIKGYRAILDNRKLGIGFSAFVTVGLSVHTKDSQQAFEQAIEKSDEVLECHNVTGPYEYLLRVETADLVAYKTFHTDVLGDLPQVATISTHVIMESTKDERK
ncbi:AsnC family transcriptional regulator [Psychrosphaera saromensis]|uniref:Leucine-responsive regulatory protein n=1 Tax=Psychrosphaera saromensis TaxID=716813 RepID=A0A2S7UTZ1_9GAMM|nr:Lrp/AsnC family transcriptional regulator [Psychrosphaera saromensis]PQJ53199.1 AsnC family transcriptional regulator [Psychrosphaera saromensis]GHB67222.1 AsnC family transcriptional regulator [Psychrosphaera saromensis]GLQ15038.1 AsnC family transcriptional regulator [Psychrosphaera saromensis]